MPKNATENQFVLLTVDNLGLENRKSNKMNTNSFFFFFFFLRIGTTISFLLKERNRCFIRIKRKASFHAYYKTGIFVEFVLKESVFSQFYCSLDKFFQIFTLL